MNPYLRIHQPIRPSTYFYAKEILQGEWPEMESVSSTTPIPHAEILEEEPISEKRRHEGEPYSALATIGLFFGDDFIEKAQAYKWLMVANRFFRYVTFDEVINHQEAQNPLYSWEKGYAAGFWWTDVTDDLWESIDQMMDEEVKAWEPPPPTSEKSAEAAIVNALRRQPKSEAFTVPSPDPNIPNSGVQITYAIWTTPFPGKRPPFPIFAIRRDTARQDPHHDMPEMLGLISFEAEHVVNVAYSMIDNESSLAFPENFNPQPVRDNLKREVQRLLRSHQTLPKTAWTSTWDDPSQSPPPSAPGVSPWD